MTPIDIRNNRALAIALAVVGALLLLVSLLGTVQLISLIAGAVILLLGVMLLINPMMRIEAHEVQVRNPLGMTLRRFPVSSPADLRFEGNKLIHVPQGKAIGTLGFGANREDVNRLRAQVQAPGR